MLEQIGRNAKAASRVLAIASGEQKNEALAAVAQALRDRAADICAENERDLAAGRESGLSEALLDRLMMHGEYGIEDVCLSTLTLVDRQGVRGKIANHLTDGEIAKLRISAERLKDVISQIQITDPEEAPEKP